MAAILVGGAAAILHGSAFVTQDVDFCCAWDRSNLERLATALNSVHPRFRVEGEPAGITVPGGLTWQHFANSESLAFITDIGNVDVRKAVDGIGTYAKVKALSREEKFGRHRMLVLSVKGLLQSKRAMGRPRDRAMIPELELMREAEALRRKGRSLTKRGRGISR